MNVELLAGRDAADEEAGPGHEDALHGVPQVREQQDVRLQG